MKTETELAVQTEKYTFILDDEKYTTSAQKVTGEMLLKIAGKTPIKCFTLYRKLKKKEGDFERISLEEKIILSDKDVEHFVTKEPEEFEYTLDGEHEMTNKKIITPAEILRNGNANPDEVYLILKNTDGSETSFKDKLDAQIKMLCPTMQFETKLLTGTTVS